MHLKDNPHNWLNENKWRSLREYKDVLSFLVNNVKDEIGANLAILETSSQRQLYLVELDRRLAEYFNDSKKLVAKKDHLLRKYSIDENKDIDELAESENPYEKLFAFNPFKESFGFPQGNINAQEATILIGTAYHAQCSMKIQKYLKITQDSIEIAERLTIERIDSKLSVPQLALLFRLLNENQFDVKNKNALSRTIVKTFSTKKTTIPSFDNFNNYFTGSKTISDYDNQTILNLLSQMLEQLQK